MKFIYTNYGDGDWRKWFAWHPVVVGGAVVWLAYVQRKWDAESNFRLIDACDHGAYDGSWRYREAA